MAFVQFTPLLRTIESAGASTLTFGSNVAAGHGMVLWMGNYPSGISTVTDSQGNTWNRYIQVGDGGINYGEVWICQSAIGGANVVTVTPVAGSGNFLTGLVGEWDTELGALDQTGTGLGSSTATTGGSTGQAAELTIAFIVADDSADPCGFSTPPGFTLALEEQNSNTYTAFLGAYRVESATGVKSAAFGNTSGVSCDSGIVTVVLPTGGGSTVTASASLSAVIQAARAATASGGAAVQAPRSSASSVDTAVRGQRSAQAALEAAVQRLLTASASVQVAVQRAASTSGDVQAAVQLARSVSADLDAALQLARSTAAGIDAQVQASTGLSALLDLQVQAGSSISTSVQAAVLQAYAAVVPVDLAVQLPRSAAAALDAALQSVATAAAQLAAAVSLVRNASAGLDAQVQAGTSLSASLEAGVLATSIAAAGVQVATQVARSASSSLATAVSVHRLVQAAIDAGVQQVQARTASLGAYVLAEGGAVSRTADLAVHAAGGISLTPALQQILVDVGGGVALDVDLLP